jgi:hypothetical protein
MLISKLLGVCYSARDLFPVAVDCGINGPSEKVIWDLLIDKGAGINRIYSPLRRKFAQKHRPTSSTDNPVAPRDQC